MLLNDRAEQQPRHLLQEERLCQPKHESCCSSVLRHGVIVHHACEWGCLGHQGLGQRGSAPKKQPERAWEMLAHHKHEWDSTYSPRCWLAEKNASSVGF